MGSHGKQHWGSARPGWAGRPGQPRPTATGVRVVKLALLVLAGLSAGEAAAQERSGGAAFAIEAAGGTLGSLAGYGIGRAIVDEDACGDDLGCIFSGVGTVLLASSAGATLGAWALGSAADTDPSIGGAALGSLAGAAAGLGLLKVLEEIDPQWDEGGAAVIALTLSQGIVTALGSRIGAALR